MNCRGGGVSVKVVKVVESHRIMKVRICKKPGLCVTNMHTILNILSIHFIFPRKLYLCFHSSILFALYTKQEMNFGLVNFKNKNVRSLFLLST